MLNAINLLLSSDTAYKAQGCYVVLHVVDAINFVVEIFDQSTAATLLCRTRGAYTHCSEYLGPRNYVFIK